MKMRTNGRQNLHFKTEIYVIANLQEIVFMCSSVKTLKSLLEEKYTLDIFCVL